MYILLGEKTVGAVTREGGGHVNGSVALEYLPVRISPACNAFSVAVAALAPLAGDCDPKGCAGDLKKIDNVCAPIAYESRPHSETHLDATDWHKMWTDRVFEHARELTKESRFRRLASAVEDALFRATSLSVEQVRQILQGADREL